ncbi:MAG: TIGR01777 family oxidoreductase [Syntrophorhabdaceae bacterium]|nr:TIGR01777 family oxidoreductase [Syntrophorhabdaceae bacterium]
MKLLITGGTGFVGRELSSRLIQEGHEVTILTRSLKSPQKQKAGLSYLEGDPTEKGQWQEAVKDYNGVINLAGASIFSKWSEEYKKTIRDSRVFTTRNIVEAIPQFKDKEFHLFSASAVGYYGFHGDEEFTEESPPGSDFLASVAAEWEAEAKKAQDKGTRVVITRFGIVLGERGGALGQMVPLFKRFIGGPIGSGRQWFSWVHIKDLSEAFIFLIKHHEITGSVNICSPNPVRNRDLAKAIGRVLNRPSFVPAPGFMVKLVLGEFGSVILKGQKVIPKRLLEKGFLFQFPEINSALESILK